MLMFRIVDIIKEVNRLVTQTSDELRALPRPIIDSGAHLHQLCGDFVDDLARSIKGENDQRDLALAIAEADSLFLQSLQHSISQFGLADYEQQQRGELPKTANYFLFAKDQIISQSLQTPTTESDEPSDGLLSSPFLQASPRRRRTQVARRVNRTPPTEEPGLPEAESPFAGTSSSCSLLTLY